MAVHCTHIRPVEHSKPARSVEHDAETRINTRTPHYVLLLQVLIFPVSGLIFPVSGLWNREAWDASPLGVLRVSSPGACVGRTSPVARHPASCTLHPASGWLVVGWAGLGWWLAGLGWAGLVVGWAGWIGWWLVVGWWLVGGWLVVGGWWLVGWWYTLPKRYTRRV
jgi:hypothetical protein